MSEQQIASAALGDEDEIFGTVDAVEIEKQPMIDFGLVENEKDAEFIQHEIEEIVEASVALEQYIEVLNKARWDGVPKQTARVIMVGVKQIDSRFGERSALAISMEDETDGPQRIGSELEQSKLSKDGLVGHAKELWVKFIEFLKRALEKIKQGAQKLLGLFDRSEKKIAELDERMDSYNPNGPKGGRKITISGKTALYAYHDGKHVDPADLLAVVSWIENEAIPFVKKGFVAWNGLKGEETAEEIQATVPHDINPPSQHPSNITFSTDENGITYQLAEMGESVELQVRSKQERKVALEASKKLVAASRKATDLVMTTLDSFPFQRAELGDAFVTEKQAALLRLKQIMTVAYELAKYVGFSSFDLLDLMNAEDRDDPAEVSNETYDYAMEDFGDTVKNGLKKLIEAFKALVAKLKDRWTKLMNSPEIMTAKTEAAKEKVKANKGAPPKAENPTEEKSAPEPEKMHTVFISGPMATAICENGKLISPERYIPLTKYVIGTVGKQLAPMVDKLIDGYNAGDLDAMRSVAEFDLPVFDDEIVNGWKVAYDADGSFAVEGEELDTTEITWPTFDELMAMFASMEKVSNTMSELGKEANRVKMIAKMEKFSLQLMTDLTKKENSEKVKVAMDSRVKLMQAISSATEVVYWLNSRTFEFLTFSMKH